MMVILEGPDGGGKTTLALRLSRMSGIPIISGEGPPKSPEEFRERLERYHMIDYPVVCDRHPVISDPIYATAFGRHSLVTDEDRRRLYNRPPFIVYCRSTKLASNHDHPSDTPEYVQALTKNFKHIVELYDLHFHHHPPSVEYRWPLPIPPSLIDYL